MGSLKPGNFFLGLLDFLGIFVPGAVLLFILLDVHLVRELIDNEFHFADASLEEGQPDSKPTQTTSTQFRSAAAFFFGAYFLGHFVYLIGSLFRSSPRVLAENRETSFFIYSRGVATRRQLIGANAMEVYWEGSGKAPYDREKYLVCILQRSLRNTSNALMVSATQFLNSTTPATRYGD